MALTDKDYLKLESQITKQRFYKLADVQDKIEKVAFDVVRFKDDDDLSRLWVIQPSADGDVIVAMYDDSDDALETKSWQAIADKQANINVFYKGEPIKRLAMSSLGIPKEDISIVCRSLTKKLATDFETRKALLMELPIDERYELVQKYPELKD